MSSSKNDANKSKHSPGLEDLVDFVDFEDIYEKNRQSESSVVNEKIWCDCSCCCYFKKYFGCFNRRQKGPLITENNDIKTPFMENPDFRVKPNDGKKYFI